ncbi:unnamed protein product [Nippostrongylus brasiliensis]|uniref:Carboxypeptidase n=1 Tax=Nippostrongylus brasiliensis TaxID=27835 RepID=A0A158R030_NIPBR|nr:unnamed protein product [Nippostrongylus brasiliensis]
MLFLFAGVLVAFSSAAPEWERVTSLPNLVEPLRSDHYAGYVQLSPAKELFYWYIESENSPATDPVVLWLNGGPGCSSMQGLFLEMGPLRVNDYGETVTRNPWTWNRYANIIYLDAPAGVGFSVRMDGRWNYTDAEVAADNHQALKMWFQKYPERAGNDFYVAGESYGGTYVPMLSSLLLDDKDFNFKGMLIGNGCVDDVLNYNSVVNFNYNHGFIDESSVKEWSFQTNYLGQANLYTGLDPYFVYYTCYLNPHDAPASSSSDVAAAVLRTHLRRKSPGTRYANAQPACAHHNDSTVYLQRADVRAALNIMNYVPPYETCKLVKKHGITKTVLRISSDAISQYYDLGATHILSQADNFRKVMKSGKAVSLIFICSTSGNISFVHSKVALFYGDEDTLCNAVHGAQLVANLGLEEVAPFAPYVDDQQLPSTIGLLTQYQGLDFLTVRGAGHFVASSNEKPKEALQVFVNFLKKTSYNTSVSHDKPYIPPTTTSAASTVTQFVPSDWDAPPWLVTSLPNLDEPLVSKHYTGYLNISENKKMFYWYVESENDPVNDPVLLWLNGGPGCSSLEGLFVEMGPLRASNSGANISRNEWTWNRVANIIYLDSPAGVGFSAALNGTPIYTDEEVANDNHVALTEWFKKFPDRIENDFYVAGESYAGTYAPMLAVKLIETFQNFKGILVGNGCVDDRLLYNSLVGFNYDHTFIDEK